MAGPHGWTGAVSGDFDVAGNWDTAAVPANTEAWYARSGSVPITQNLDQSAKTFSSVHIGKGYSGDIGSAAGGLKFSATSMTVEGGGNLFIDNTGETITKLIVLGTGAGKTFWMIGTGTTTAAKFVGGDIQLTAGTITRGHFGGSLTSPAVNIANATVTTGLFSNGSLRLNGTGTLTTFYQMGGVVTVDEGTLTTLWQLGGVHAYRSPQTVTLAVIGRDASFDMSGDQRAKVVTELEMHPGCTVNLDNGASNITGTNFRRIGGTLIGLPNGFTNVLYV